MNESTAFFYLGIPVTKDTAAIKKAYQTLVSQHHPEEDPQGFMRLHQAYKAALAYARGTSRTQSPSMDTFWQTDNRQSSQEETGYDSLFTDLGREEPLDLPQLKKAFSRKLLMLKLHWLPIPLKSWVKFFSSEVFLLCREEPECMEKLFELLLGKIHSYGVFRLLLDRLWELDAWQKSEEKEELANKTKNCIAELCEQYRHYRKLDTNSWAKRNIYPLWWYYQALPFYFKLLASCFLLPVAACGSGVWLINLMIIFYILEFAIWFLKIYRKLGVFHPTARMKNGVLRFKCRGDSGIFIAVTIYTILFHLVFSVAFFEAITGG